MSDYEIIMLLLQVMAVVIAYLSRKRQIALRYPL